MTLEEFLDKIPRGKLLIMEGGRYYEAEETIRAFVRLVRNRSTGEWPLTYHAIGVAFDEIVKELGLEEK